MAVIVYLKHLWGASVTTNDATWLSLWEPLMEEAARSCLISAQGPNREMAAAAASIVLARTGWEAFANEFIEQRDLTLRLKNAPIRDKLEGVFDELEGSKSSWEGRKVWSDFLLVSDTRNFIAHQKNVMRSPTDASERVLHAFEEAGVVSPVFSATAWEKRVLRTKVARWCCITSGNAVIALEEIPAKQFRNSEHIRTRVSRALACLRELPNA